MTITERAERIIRRAVPDSDCLVLHRCLNADGYAEITGPNSTYLGLAHRIVYEALVGSIPAGYEVDHLCFVRNCVKVEHLEAVTRQENCRRRNARITECPAGHEYSPANTYVWRGKRSCRECNRDAARRYKASRRAS